MEYSPPASFKPDITIPSPNTLLQKAAAGDESAYNIFRSNTRDITTEKREEWLKKINLLSDDCVYKPFLQADFTDSFKDKCTLYERCIKRWENNKSKLPIKSYYKYSQLLLNEEFCPDRTSKAYTLTQKLLLETKGISDDAWGYVYLCLASLFEDHIKALAPHWAYNLHEITDLYINAIMHGEVNAKYYLYLFFKYHQEKAYAPHNPLRRNHQQDAEYWLKEAAESGIARAQYRLGQKLIAEGNVTVGCTWLKKAAKQGLADAYSALGELIDQKGEDHFNLSYTDRANEALFWHSQAIFYKSKKAYSKTGDFFSNERNHYALDNMLPRDMLEQAKSMYKEAIKLGSKKAKLKLAQLYQYEYQSLGVSREIAFKKTDELYRELLSTQYSALTKPHYAFIKKHWEAIGLSNLEALSLRSILISRIPKKDLANYVDDVSTILKEIDNHAKANQKKPKQLAETALIFSYCRVILDTYYEKNPSLQNALNAHETFIKSTYIHKKYPQLTCMHLLHPGIPLEGKISLTQNFFKNQQELIYTLHEYSPIRNNCLRILYKFATVLQFHESKRKHYIDWVTHLTEKYFAPTSETLRIENKACRDEYLKRRECFEYKLQVKKKKHTLYNYLTLQLIDIILKAQAVRYIEVRAAYTRFIKQGLFQFHEPSKRKNIGNNDEHNLLLSHLKQTIKDQEALIERLERDDTSDTDSSSTDESTSSHELIHH